MYMETFTIKTHPTDISQIETLKAFLKALKIKFEIAQPAIPTKKAQIYDEKSLLISEIKESIEELKLAKAGKLKLKTAEELYNKL